MRQSTRVMMKQVHERLIEVKRSDKRNNKLSYVNMIQLQEDTALSKTTPFTWGLLALFSFYPS